MPGHIQPGPVRIHDLLPKLPLPCLCLPNLSNARYDKFPTDALAFIHAAAGVPGIREQTPTIVTAEYADDGICSDRCFLHLKDVLLDEEALVWSQTL